MYSPVQYHIYSNYVVLDYMYVKYGVGFKHMKSIHVYGTKLQYCADRYYTLALVLIIYVCSNYVVLAYMKHEHIISIT